MGASAIRSDDWLLATPDSRRRGPMQADSLVHLSRAIEAVLDAVVVPALLLLGAALLMTAAAEIRAHVRQRREPARPAGWPQANGAASDPPRTSRTRSLPLAPALCSADSARPRPRRSPCVGTVPFRFSFRKLAEPRCLL